MALSINQINAFTERQIEKKFVNNAYFGTALLAALTRGDRLVKKDGGTVIDIPVMNLKMNQSGAYTGYDILQTGQEETATVEFATAA